MYNVLFMATQLAEVFVAVAAVAVFALGGVRRPLRVMALAFELSFLPTLFLRLSGTLAVFYMSEPELRVFTMAQEAVKLVRAANALLFVGYLHAKGYLVFSRTVAIERRRRSSDSPRGDESAVSRPEAAEGGGRW